MNGTAFLFALQPALAAENVPAATSAISIQDALLIILTGALLFLAKAFAALRARVEELEEQRSAPAASTTPVQPASSAAPLGADTIIPPDVLAVIAAAVHVSLEGNARILSITPETNNPVWSLEGRRQIFHSHQIR